LKGIEAGAVTVTPARLERIPSNILPAKELKACVRVTHVRSLDVPQYVRLAAAGSAGAGPSQAFKGEIGFFAIIPVHREFVTDELDIFRLKSHLFLLTDYALTATGGSSAPSLDAKPNAHAAPN
jgi:hypothetical protein